ncbi:MAG TPA: hypothetical protein VIQ30_02155 [Pseudonocardia sp.]
MSHTPGYVSPNRPLNLRIQPIGRKQEFLDVARAAGDVPTDLLNDFVAWYLGVTDELPTRPEVTRDHLRPAVEASA